MLNRYPSPPAPRPSDGFTSWSPKKQIAAFWIAFGSVTLAGLIGDTPSQAHADKPAKIEAAVRVTGDTLASGERIQEDDPRWDCRTMGNKTCGTTTTTEAPTTTTTAPTTTTTEAPTTTTVYVPTFREWMQANYATHISWLNSLDASVKAAADMKTRSGQVSACSKILEVLAVAPAFDSPSGSFNDEMVLAIQAYGRGAQACIDGDAATISVEFRLAIGHIKTATSLMEMERKLGA